MEEAPRPKWVAPDSLPLGEARLARPANIVPLSFEDLLHRRRNLRAALEIVPIEALQPGDTQVLAAREPAKHHSPIIDLDGLADIPSVRSVIASTTVRVRRELPELRELLFIESPLMPDAGSMDNLTGLESLYAAGAHSDVRIALDRLPVNSLWQLSIPRWATQSVLPLAKLTGLRQLSVEMYPVDSVEPVSELHNLTYLRISHGKGWASLRSCVQLEEAHLIDVRMANLRRWNTWKRLRHLVLTGSGLKSLAGIEAMERLETLTLIMITAQDLSPIRELPNLREVTFRYVRGCRDLSGLAGLPELRRLTIDQAVGSDRDIVHIETLKPLAALRSFEEVVLRGTAIDDGDLSPLAELPNLRKVRLGGHTGADVNKLRVARPDLAIESSSPAAKSNELTERIGQITIRHPGGGMQDWSIYDDLAGALKVETNYAAEQQIRRVMKKIAPDLLRRIDFDTEAGGVGIYAKTEADIRTVASILGGLLPKTAYLAPAVLVQKRSICQSAGRGGSGRSKSRDGIPTRSRIRCTSSRMRSGYLPLR
jgi:Leucine-rich repeat (LRR) protein